jgi:hypothetical protein
LVKPDYAKSVESVYVELAIAYIRKTGSLKILSMVFGELQPEDGMPSWVPNWKHSLQEPRWQEGRLARYELCNACGELKAARNLNVPNNHHLLEDRGLYYDAVSEVGTLREPQSKEVLPEDWARIACVDSRTATLYDKTGYWRVILLDSIVKKDHHGRYTEYTAATRSDYTKDQTWLESLLTGRSWLKTDLKLKATIDTATIMRRLFITNSGALGLGPREMLSGDEIYILPGGKCPLVLRKAIIRGESSQNNNLVGGGAYTLVGDCFVDGIMNGNTVEDFDSKAVVVRLI